MPNYQPHGGAIQFSGGQGYDSHKFGGNEYNAPRDTLSGRPVAQGDYGNSLKDHVYSEAEKISMFMGTPNYDAINRDINWATMNSYSDFIELFQNNYAQYFPDNYTGRIIMEKARADENWPLQISPWRLTTTQTFAWSEMRFHRHMMDRLAEQGVPRNTTYTMRGGSKSMVRYGMCLMHEATFYKTPQGQRIHMLNIEQLKIAVIETAGYAVVVSMLDSRPMPGIGSRPSPAMTLEEISAQIATHNLCFCRLQKGSTMAQLEASCYAELRKRNADGHLEFIYPQGSQAYLGGQPRQMLGTAPDQETPNSHRISRSFVAGPHAEARDPCFKRVTNGGFFTLWDHDETDFSDWKTSNYGCRVFNEAINTFAPADMELMKKSGIWNFDLPYAPIENEIADSLLADLGVYTWGGLLDKYKDWDRTLTKLAALKDQDAQDEFYNSLQLIAEDDPTIKGGAYSQDEQDRIRYACTQNIDRQVNVPTLKRVKDSLSTGIPTAFPGEYEQVDRQNRRQAKRYERSAPEVALGEADEFDQNMEIVSSESVDEYVTRSDGTKQKITRGPVKRFRAVPGPRLKSQVDILKDDIRAIADSVGSKTAKYTHPVTKEESLITPLRAEPLFEQILTCSGATDEEFIIRYLSAFKQVLRGETIRHAPDISYNLEKNDVSKFSVKDVLHIVLCSFIPMVVQLQVKPILQGVISQQTPLEIYCEENKIVKPRLIPSEYIKDGFWHPGGVSRNTGHVKLVSFPGLHDLSLEAHDAFACTVSARHSVLFKVDNDKPLKITHIDSDMMEQGRLDLLVVNIILSHLAACANDATINNYLTTLFADSEVLRIVDIYCNKHATFQTPIPSQVHLGEFIANLYSQLVLWVKSGELRAPVAEVRDEDDEITVEAKGPIKSYVFKDTKRPTNGSDLDAKYCDNIEYVEKNGYQPPRVPDTGMESLLSALRTANANASDIELCRNYFHVIFPTDELLLTRQTIINLGKLSKTLGINLKGLSDSLEKVLTPEVKPDVQMKETGSWTKAGLKKTLMRAWIGSGTYQTFCAKYNIPMPMYVRGWRPNRAYDTGCLIGYVPGNMVTYFMNPDWMASDDAARKTVFGNLSIYFSPHIFDNDKIVVLPDAICRGYVNGNTMGVWNPFSEYDKQQYMDGNMGHASMFITMGPMRQASQAHTGTNWLILSDRIPKEFNASHADDEKMYLPGMRGFLSFWGMHAHDSMQPKFNTDAFIYEPNSNSVRFNVICCQEVQIDVYNPVKRDRSGVILDTGAWGPNVDTGCSAARGLNGPLSIKEASYIRNPNYTIMSA